MKRSGKQTIETGDLAMQSKAVKKRSVAQVQPVSRFTEFDIYLYKQGKHYKLYEKFGSHLMEHGGKKGCYFAVWAPNAKLVSVMGDFNEWNAVSSTLYKRWDDSGIWEGFIPGIKKGARYKYHIESTFNDYRVDKSDPYAFRAEVSPGTASIVTDLDYQWNDRAWQQARESINVQQQPYAIYEIHLGSWKRVAKDKYRSLSYLEMAKQLPAYLKDMGFTHVELMPVMEHPFFGSWGYQITNYFSASANYGTPQELMQLIDALHQAGIGVIFDWVPSHFPDNENGLVYFDGTHLYEHEDPRLGYHPDWKSYIFNYGRNEVRSFLISNACFWCERFHADGLRVDAVASMLHLDYSRKEGEWIPNEFGGRDNLQAISFVQELNKAVYGAFPGIFTIAEESTDHPKVSHPVYTGGLGFGMKWAMGWMHDTLNYLSKSPEEQEELQNQITFSILYFFSENFILPLSHDEVVHLKKSLVYKMHGDEWQQFARLRLLYGYMYGHPGGKLLFMGGEFGQTDEWNHDGQLQWQLLQYDFHKGVQHLVRDLNQLYKTEKALSDKQFNAAGFEWADIHQIRKGVISFVRKGDSENDTLLVCCNFTPTPIEHYPVSVPRAGRWHEILNTDKKVYHGSNTVNPLTLSTVSHESKNKLTIQLPPLGVTFLKWVTPPENP